MVQKLNSHLPKVLENILEFRIINDNLEIELKKIDRGLLNITKEVSVFNASDYGIKRWENILGITTNENEDIYTRKFRIINILQNKAPFTEIWLRRKLTDIIGSENGYRLTINHNNYNIKIVINGLDTQLMNIIEENLREIIPANMSLLIGGEPLSVLNLTVAGVMRKSYKITIDSNY